MISIVLKWCVIFHAVSYVVIAADGQGCFHPGQRHHSKANISNEVDKDGKYSVNTIASYSCDPGYQILNNESRQCLNNGTWSGTEPYCGVNVGISAKVLTSPNMEKIVLSDYFGECQQLNASETIFNIEFNQSYIIDLLTLTLQADELVHIVTVTYNISTPNPNVRDKTAVLLKNYSDTSNNQTNVVFQYTFDNSSLARQLSFKIVGPKDNFFLCGIALYSISAIPEDWCKSDDESDSKNFKHLLYEDKCYVVIGEKHKSAEANNKCRDYRKSSNSTLVVFNEGSYQYIKDSLRNTALVDQYYWISDMNNQNKCCQIYFDEDMKLEITESCGRNYGRICQFDIPKCGTPDQKSLTVMTYKEGSTTANYSCPNKLFELVGSEVRHCSKGRWSPEALTCKELFIPSTTMSEVDSSTETSTTVTNLSNCTTESNLQPSCESQVNAIYNKIIETTCIVVAVFVILICLTTGLALVYIKNYLKVK